MPISDEAKEYFQYGIDKPASQLIEAFENGPLSLVKNMNLATRAQAQNFFMALPERNGEIESDFTKLNRQEISAALQTIPGLKNVDTVARDVYCATQYQLIADHINNNVRRENSLEPSLGFKKDESVREIGFEGNVRRALSELSPQAISEQLGALKSISPQSDLQDHAANFKGLHALGFATDAREYSDNLNLNLSDKQKAFLTESLSKPVIEQVSQQAATTARVAMPSSSSRRNSVDAFDGDTVVPNVSLNDLGKQDGSAPVSSPLTPAQQPELVSTPTPKPKPPSRKSSGAWGENATVEPTATIKEKEEEKSQQSASNDSWATRSNKEARVPTQVAPKQEEKDSLTTQPLSPKQANSSTTPQDSTAPAQQASVTAVRDGARTLNVGAKKQEARGSFTMTKGGSETLGQGTSPKPSKSDRKAAKRAAREAAKGNQLAASKHAETLIDNQVELSPRELREAARAQVNAGDSLKTSLNKSSSLPSLGRNLRAGLAPLDSSPRSTLGAALDPLQLQQPPPQQPPPQQPLNTIVQDTTKKVYEEGVQSFSRSAPEIVNSSKQGPVKTDNNGGATQEQEKQVEIEAVDTQEQVSEREVDQEPIVSSQQKQAITGQPIIIEELDNNELLIDDAAEVDGMKGDGLKADAMQVPIEKTAVTEEQKLDESQEQIFFHEEEQQFESGVEVQIHKKDAPQQQQVEEEQIVPQQQQGQVFTAQPLVFEEDDEQLRDMAQEEGLKADEVQVVIEGNAVPAEQKLDESQEQVIFHEEEQKFESMVEVESHTIQAPLNQAPTHFQTDQAKGQINAIKEAINNAFGPYEVINLFLPKEKEIAPGIGMQKEALDQIYMSVGKALRSDAAATNDPAALNKFVQAYANISHNEVKATAGLTSASLEATTPKVTAPEVSPAVKTGFMAKLGSLFSKAPDSPTVPKQQGDFTDLSAVGTKPIPDLITPQANASTKVAVQIDPAPANDTTQPQQQSSKANAMLGLAAIKLADMWPDKAKNSVSLVFQTEGKQLSQVEKTALVQKMNADYGGRLGKFAQWNKEQNDTYYPVFSAEKGKVTVKMVGAGVPGNDMMNATFSGLANQISKDYGNGPTFSMSRKSPNLLGQSRNSETVAPKAAAPTVVKDSLMIDKCRLSRGLRTSRFYLKSLTGTPAELQKKVDAFQKEFANHAASPIIKLSKSGVITVELGKKGTDLMNKFGNKESRIKKLHDVVNQMTGGRMESNAKYNVDNMIKDAKGKIGFDQIKIKTSVDPTGKSDFCVDVKMKTGRDKEGKRIERPLTDYQQTALIAKLEDRIKQKFGDEIKGKFTFDKDSGGTLQVKLEGAENLKKDASKVLAYITNRCDCDKKNTHDTQAKMIDKINKNSNLPEDNKKTLSDSKEEAKALRKEVREERISRDRSSSMSTP